MDNKIKAYNFGALGQALLDILIKVAVGAVLAFLNNLISTLTAGSIQLPYEAISLPVITLLVSQFDTYIVAWQKEHDDSLPPPASQ